MRRLFRSTNQVKVIGIRFTFFGEGTRQNFTNGPHADDNYIRSINPHSAFLFLSYATRHLSRAVELYFKKKIVKAMAVAINPICMPIQTTTGLEG